MSYILRADQLAVRSNVPENKIYEYYEAGLLPEPFMDNYGMFHFPGAVTLRRVLHICGMERQGESYDYMRKQFKIEPIG